MYTIVVTLFLVKRSQLRGLTIDPTFPKVPIWITGKGILYLSVFVTIISK